MKIGKRMKAGKRNRAAWRLLGGVVLFAMAAGCSPSNVNETPFEDDFREMSRVIGMGSSCGRSVYSLGGRIAALPDMSERRRCIERIKGIFLAPETERADYNLMRNRSGGRNALVGLCMDVARRCGLPFPELLEIRMAFIDWLKAERRRIVDSGVSPDDGRRLGLHITAGCYLGDLGSLYFINLWRLELQFDEEAERECRPDELKRLRARLEAFLGRPVRTREQILHDRRESSRRNMEYIESLRTSNPLPEPTGWDD